MSEYRSILSDRLLSGLDFQIEKERRILELLKVRFGEASLQNCEIMLKDVADSKRIHHNFLEVNELFFHHPMDPFKYPPPPLSLSTPCASNKQRWVGACCQAPERGVTSSKYVTVDRNCLRATIVSKLFWPTLPEDVQTLKHHPVVQRLVVGSVIAIMNSPTHRLCVFCHLDEF